jgi:hypothetical protein
MYFVRAFRGWGPFDAYMDSSAAVGRRAFALDSTLGDPWVNMITKAIYLDDDWTSAQSASRRALRAGTHDPQVLFYAAIVSGEVEGRLDTRRAGAARGGIGAGHTVPQYARRFADARWPLRLGYSGAAQRLELDPSVPGPRRRAS